MGPLKQTPSRSKLQEGVSGHYSKTVSKKSITKLQVDSVKSNYRMLKCSTNQHIYTSAGQIKGKERRDIENLANTLKFTKFRIVIVFLKITRK
jgi:ribosomal protein S24E